QQEIKTAYRDSAKVWHPDRFLNDPRLQAKAQEKLKEINEAYEKLSAYNYQPKATVSESQEQTNKPKSEPPPPQPSPSWHKAEPEPSSKQTQNKATITYNRKWLAVPIIVILAGCIF